MRQWILNRLNAVDVDQFDRLLMMYEMQKMQIHEAIEIHGMQGAWQQAGVNLKQRRLH